MKRISLALTYLPNVQHFVEKRNDGNNIANGSILILGHETYHGFIAQRSIRSILLKLKKSEQEAKPHTSFIQTASIAFMLLLGPHENMESAQ
jgi:hypothetical protein